MKSFNAVRHMPRGVTLILGLIVCTVGLIVCGFQGCSGGSSSPSTTTSSTPAATTLPVFPLVTSANHRYLQDQKGVPFPILGRTAWFITSLSEMEYKKFIDDTVAKGYNAIEFNAVNRWDAGNHPPFGGNGALPFTKRLDRSDWDGSLSYGNITTEAPDFSLTNEAYWTHVDAILAYAWSKGLLCFMFPAYTGYQGGVQGWMQEMVANGSIKMRAYGTFIADRYKTRGNIVWMLGGDYGTGANDFTDPELEVEKTMLTGMQSVQRQESLHISAEWNMDSIYADQADGFLREAGTLQGAYSFSGDVNTHTRRGYAHAPTMPAFLLEEPYDEEGPDGNRVNLAATQPVRRFQWWGWLSGIAGYISGNGYIWPFKPGWEDHLDTQGAKDMVRLNAFMRSIAWYNLVPSGLGGMRTIVIGNSFLSWSDYVAAAATLNGTLLVVYVPPDHTGLIEIDMTVMSGQTRARWFNPASAEYTSIGTFNNIEPHRFTPPGDNGTGFSDWILVLEKQ